MVWGYKEIKGGTRPNGMQLEHRVVAEKALGISLHPDWVVHHADEDKSNNDPDNLVVFETQGDHARFHMTGNIAETDVKGVFYSPKLTKKCKKCGKEFFGRKFRIFCSTHCSSANQDLKFDVTSEELSNLVWNYPTTKVADMFGVSDSSISKRCKKFGIIKPPRGYWQKLKSGNK